MGRRNKITGYRHREVLNYAFPRSPDMGVMMERPVSQDQGDAVLAELSGADEQRAEAALIAAAGRLLAGAAPDIPEDFIASLFSHAVPEDLMHCDPRQLAALAADAWSLLAVRRTGTPVIRLETPPTVAGPGR